jgi:leucyl aminopeptidase
MVALGNKVAGLFGGDDDSAEQVEAAARRAGEKVWRLPLEKEYRSKLDSPIADIKNIGDRHGGAITAALFLAEFTDERPWVHLDIAGPARAESDDGYISKGGTGFAVSTLVALAEDMSGR